MNYLPLSGLAKLPTLRLSVCSPAKAGRGTRKFVVTPAAVQWKFFVATVCFALFMPFFVASAHSKAEQSPDIEKWMNEWMNVDRLPVGTLYLSRFKDPVYFLTKPISWEPDQTQAPYERVTVPKGFVTDFASIPRLFWSLLRPDGDYVYAAIIHDYLYWTQMRTRRESDQIFEFAMQDFEIDPSVVFALHKAVEIGGFSAWRKNEELKRQGERRILRKFPQDPRITWETWKNDPAVFAD